MRKSYFFICVIIILAWFIIFIQGRLAVLLKGHIIRELGKTINTNVDIDKIGVNLFRGIISFSKLKVQNPPAFSSQNFLEIKRGYVDVALVLLLSKKVEIQKIFLEKPNVNIEINKDSVSNTGLIFKRRSQTKRDDAVNTTPQRKKGYFRINEAEVNDGIFKLTNYKVNPSGARIVFDEINLSIKDVAAPQNTGQLPTSIKCSARLPASDPIGHIEIAAKGAFLSELIDFDLDLNAKSISLLFFMPFYVNTAPVLAKKGYLDMGAIAKCREGKLHAVQKVNVRDLRLVVNPTNISDKLLFGLPVMTVVNFFVNSQGNLDFEFEITGALSDPTFHIEKALKKVFVKSIQNAILNNLSRLSNKLLEKVKETGKIEEAGREILKDVLGQILGPKEGQETK